MRAIVVFVALGAASPGDVRDLIRRVLGDDLVKEERASGVTLDGTPEEIAIAKRLIAAIDKPPGEAVVLLSLWAQPGGALLGRVLLDACDGEAAQGILGSGLSSMRVTVTPTLRPDAPLRLRVAARDEPENGRDAEEACRGITAMATDLTIGKGETVTLAFPDAAGGDCRVDGLRPGEHLVLSFSATVIRPPAISDEDRAPILVGTEEMLRVVPETRSSEGP